jgi:hypothetical protein
MLAIGIDAAKNIAIAVVIGFVVLSLVAASAIKNITGKIITTLVMAGFALGVWTQRSSLQDCAQTYRDRSAAGDVAPATCKFFGSEVDLPQRESP